MPVPTREQWQKLRDTAKVPRGAAKVSIGDSLAKVHKSLGLATVSANQKDTDQLIKNLDVYLPPSPRNTRPSRRSCSSTSGPKPKATRGFWKT
jgi:hypothetical protein